jgi:hypothetical protein
MILTETHVEALLRQRSITDDWPWVTNDEREVDKNIKSMVADIRRKLQLEDKTEYGHYGSGYASFVDCWLYRPNEQFRVLNGDHYQGLVILFSRLSPYYVIGQGEKSWHSTGGASYLPEFDFVDNIEHDAVLALVPRVNAILKSRGLLRLQKNDLDVILPKGVKVPTIMADRVYRHFDAIFYWED